VPAYNARSTVSGAVASVLAQTEAHLEVLVVDDGSTDGTAAVVRAIDDRRVHLLQQPNRGVARARNAGIAAARAELITFLDADDLLMPTYLARMGSALRADPEAAFAFCDAWMFEDGTGRVRRFGVTEPYRPPGPLPRDPVGFFLAHLRANFVYIAATVRRGVFERVGGFDGELAAAADYEMWLRIEAAGHRGVEVPERLALYRSSPGQMSKDTVAMARDLLRAFDRLAARPDLPPGAGEVLDARRRAFERELRVGADHSSWPGRRRRVRRALGRAWRRLPGRGLMLDRPPPEVAASFPDLARW
jgi:glycosyltransferase involved in cell wall biosynthesis